MLTRCKNDVTDMMFFLDCYFMHAVLFVHH